MARDALQGGTCAGCGKRIERAEPHYRWGLKWFHVACYEKATKPKPRKPPSRPRPPVGYSADLQIGRRRRVAYRHRMFISITRPAARLMRIGRNPLHTPPGQGAMDAFQRGRIMNRRWTFSCSREQADELRWWLLTAAMTLQNADMTRAGILAQAASDVAAAMEAAGD
jgi:hypothetical protein